MGDVPSSEAFPHHFLPPTVQYSPVIDFSVYIILYILEFPFFLNDREAIELQFLLGLLESASFSSNLDMRIWNSPPKEKKKSSSFSPILPQGVKGQICIHKLIGYPCLDSTTYNLL